MCCVPAVASSDILISSERTDLSSRVLFLECFVLESAFSGAGASRVQTRHAVYSVSPTTSQEPSLPVRASVLFPVFECF